MTIQEATMLAAKMNRWAARCSAAFAVLCMAIGRDAAGWLLIGTALINVGCYKMVKELL